MVMKPYMLPPCCSCRGLVSSLDVLREIAHWTYVMCRPLLLGRPEDERLADTVEEAIACGARLWTDKTGQSGPVAELLRVMYQGQEVSSASHTSEALRQITCSLGCRMPADEDLALVAESWRCASSSYF